MIIRTDRQTDTLVTIYWTIAMRGPHKFDLDKAEEEIQFNQNQFEVIL